jgi:hypothetical protein
MGPPGHLPLAVPAAAAAEVAAAGGRGGSPAVAVAVEAMAEGGVGALEGAWGWAQQSGQQVIVS